MNIFEEFDKLKEAGYEISYDMSPRPGGKYMYEYTITFRGIVIDVLEQFDYENEYFIECIEICKFHNERRIRNEKINKLLD